MGDITDIRAKNSLRNKSDRANYGCATESKIRAAMRITCV